MCYVMFYNHLFIPVPFVPAQRLQQVSTVIHTTAGGGQQDAYYYFRSEPCQGDLKPLFQLEKHPKKRNIYPCFYVVKKRHLLETAIYLGDKLTRRKI